MIQNLYLDKVCVVNFHLNKTDCSSHNKTSVLDIDPADEVQRYVSDLNIYASLIENIPVCASKINFRFFEFHKFKLDKFIDRTLCSSSFLAPGAIKMEEKFR